MRRFAAPQACIKECVSRPDASLHGHNPQTLAQTHTHTLHEGLHPALRQAALIRVTQESSGAGAPCWLQHTHDGCRAGEHSQSTMQTKSALHKHKQAGKRLQTHTTYNLTGRPESGPSETHTHTHAGPLPRERNPRAQPSCIKSSLLYTAAWQPHRGLQAAPLAPKHAATGLTLTPHHHHSITGCPSLPTQPVPGLHHTHAPLTATTSPLDASRPCACC